MAKIHQKSQNQASHKAPEPRLIERKLRKYVRLNRLFRKGGCIKVDDKLCKCILKAIIKGLPVSYSTSPEKASKIVIPWTLDDEINDFLSCIFSKKKPAKQKKLVKLLLPITDNEADILAKFYNAKFTPGKKDIYLQQLLSSLSKKHPEIKYALLKTAMRLKQRV